MPVEHHRLDVVARRRFSTEPGFGVHADMSETPIAVLPDLERAQEVQSLLRARAEDLWRPDHSGPTVDASHPLVLEAVANAWPEKEWTVDQYGRGAFAEGLPADPGSDPRFQRDCWFKATPGQSPWDNWAAGYHAASQESDVERTPTITAKSSDILQHHADVARVRDRLLHAYQTHDASLRFGKAGGRAFLRDINLLVHCTEQSTRAIDTQSRHLALGQHEGQGTQFLAACARLASGEWQLKTEDSGGRAGAGWRIYQGEQPVGDWASDPGTAFSYAVEMHAENQEIARFMQVVRTAAPRVGAEPPAASPVAATPSTPVAAALGT